MNMEKLGRVLFFGGILLVMSIFFSAALDFSSRMQDGAIVYGVCVVTGLVMAFLGLSVIYFNAKPDKQKKVAYRILFVSIFLFLVGAFFKMQHWPGANAGVAIGLLLFCFSFLPLIIKYRYEKRKHIFTTKHVILSFADLASLILIFLFVLFKYLHWQGAAAILIIGVVGFITTMVLRNRAFSNEVLLRHDAESKLKHAFGELEEKNKEILDSINYAQRIQHALLASDSMLKKNLPEHFVLFKPKDVVSGDFYWATNAHNKFYFIIADSTGHGVPGAFMSLLNISFLNEAINEKGIEKPNEILNYVRQKLITALAIEGSDEGGNDGMDCSLMVFDSSSKKMEVCCANNPIIIIRNTEIIEIAADKIPVGKSVKNNQSFTLQTIELQKDDMLFAFTDGFADQFGGPKGKKLKFKQLCENLIQNKNLPLKRQQEELFKLFSNWKGELEQIDDVLIIGIKI